MAEWCAENLRDTAGWNSAGLPVSTTSNESARMLDGTIRQVVSLRDCDSLGGIVASFEKLKEHEEHDAMTRAFLLCMSAMGTGTSVLSNPAFRKEVEEAEAVASSSSSINDRERQHLRAAALWARGQFPTAEAVWEEILVEYPNDIFAVKFAHDSYFFSGNAQGKKTSVARVLPKWQKDEPCRSYLHGMLAFGLEECGEYAEAERNSLIALSERKEDTWATHARAHVMEMQGRTKEGRKFMDDTVQNWEPGWILAAHNHWHRALYCLEDGEAESALTIWDTEIARRAKTSEGMLDLVDAASLLWRLELEGCSVGERWRDLHSMSSSHLDDHFLCFNDLHFGMALKRGTCEEAEGKLHQSLYDFAKSGPSNYNQVVAAEVGLDLYEGMMAYADEDYAKTVAKMMPIRNAIHKIGGSHAQNDVFAQTLIHACLRSGQRDHEEYAKQLLLERDSRRDGHSGIAERLRKKLSDGVNRPHSNI